VGGLSWKSESELLGEAPPEVKTPETLQEWIAVLDRLCKDTERPGACAVHCGKRAAAALLWCPAVARLW
jgi:hypothetical protein